MTVSVLSAVCLSKHDFTGIAWDHCDTEKLPRPFPIRRFPEGMENTGSPPDGDAWLACEIRTWYSVQF